MPSILDKFSFCCGDIMVQLFAFMIGERHHFPFNCLEKERGGR